MATTRISSLNRVEDYDDNDVMVIDGVNGTNSYPLSSFGASVVESIPLATTSNDGLMSGTDKYDIETLKTQVEDISEQCKIDYNNLNYPGMITLPSASINAETPFIVPFDCKMVSRQGADFFTINNVSLTANGVLTTTSYFPPYSTSQFELPLEAGDEILGRKDIDNNKVALIPVRHGNVDDTRFVTVEVDVSSLMDQTNVWEYGLESENLCYGLTSDTSSDKFVPFVGVDKPLKAKIGEKTYTVATIRLTNNVGISGSKSYVSLTYNLNTGFVCQYCGFTNNVWLLRGSGSERVDIDYTIKSKGSYMKLGNNSMTIMQTGVTQYLAMLMRPYAKMTFKILKI